MGKKLDLTGQTFGRLTVVRRSEKRWNDMPHHYYDCECSCGNDALHIRCDSLRNGISRSCGCLRAETNREKGRAAAAAKLAAVQQHGA